VTVLAGVSYKPFSWLFPTFRMSFAQVVGSEFAMKPKGNNNEAIRWGCSFLCGTYPGETPLSDVRFLTVAEVALIMRVSKMTVYRLVHSGELEAIRVGRSFRVPEQAVNQYLRAAFVGT
jgi:excisionase family DNA binding protein